MSGTKSGLTDAASGALIVGVWNGIDAVRNGIDFGMREGNNGYIYVITTNATSPEHKRLPA
jgi:hypothetical protein